MLLVSYDISNDKLRTQFSHFLSKFGFRLQYSVFEIHNSSHILNNLELEIKATYLKRFTETDSIIIFDLTKDCKRTCYGYARHEDEDLLIID